MNSTMPALMSATLIAYASLTVSAGPPHQSTTAVRKAGPPRLTATLDVVKPQMGDPVDKVDAAGFPHVRARPMGRGPDCAPDEATIDMEILTDSWPYDTTWEVTEYYTGMIVCSGGPYDQPNTLYNESCCIGYHGCVDFAIFDSYGDGINSPGGYAVYYEGELVYSCIGEGWCCWCERVEQIGDGCIIPPSACCVDQVCVGSMFESECDWLGGEWYVWEICPDFDCPECGVEFCVDAPYEGEMRNTCGAGNDCPLRPSEEHEYGVAVPHDGVWTFSLCGSAFDTYLFVGTSRCSQDIGYNDDFCGLQSQLTATLTGRLYYVTVEAYAAGDCGEYVLNVWEEIPPVGACCVGLDCVATNTQDECLDMGGTSWWEGEDCFGEPPFECPQTPANDLCQNATPVNARYPVTIEGESTQLATIDCPGFLDWTAIWYDLELPYANNDVTVTICPTGEDLGTVGVILMDDCNCDDYVLYSGYSWITCESGWQGITIEFDQVQGYERLYFPAYVINSSSEGIVFDITFEVTEHLPCYVECPEGGIPEGEPDCFDGYEDTYNGGCNSSPYVWRPIECGDTICGTSGVYGNNYYRDTDWFEIEITVPSTVTWTAVAEFPVLIFIINAGTGDCVDYTILSSATADECDEISLTESVAPGLYWFWIGPSDWGDYPCGADSEYVATLTCEAVTGACCDDETGICEDGVPAEQCPAPLRFAADTLCADLSPPCGGCPQAVIYIEILTDSWPYETTWEVTDFYTGDMVASGGPYDQPDTLYTAGVCVDYESCHNFTIYDSYGDGIIAPGGYAVYYEGELIHSCMGQGWCCRSQTVEGIGDGCVWPEGACCVFPGGHQGCIATNTEDECDALGGFWYEGETCPEFWCPGPLVDFWVDAPYAGPMRTTCGARNDCALRPSEEHEYEVTIPTDGRWTFSLCGSEYDTYLYVGTTICGQEVGYNDDYCGLQSQLTAEVTAGYHYVTVEGYTPDDCGNYILNVWEEIPCDTECPEGGTIEGEPICYDNYVDTYNAGCSSWPPAFQPIACGETICGTSGTFFGNGLGYRDSDWFEIELDSATNVTWTVCAEFEVLIFVIDGGSGDCTDYAILGYRIGPAFEQTTLSLDVGPGLYWFWVGPMAFGSGVPCGSEYVATLIVCPGDIDRDCDTDLTDLALLLSAFGSVPGDPNWNPACDLDADNDVDQTDVTLLLSGYGCGG
jgi:hypothetical protein